MRRIVEITVREICPPSVADRQGAIASGGSADAHERFLSDWPSLSTIELMQPANSDTRAAELVVAAWNIERCKRVEESAEVIRRSGADVLLATEMDLGMARSGQRNTTRDLAGILNLGYAFGVEFVELGIGDERESRDFLGKSDLHGLHGNAILSRFPMTDVALIPLDDGGAWYVRAPKGDGQHRVGGRMALAARTGGIVVAAVHFESESDANDRARQTDRLLTGLADLYGSAPAVIGGDLNTRGFLDNGVSSQDMLEEPSAVEPAFQHFAAAGFDWQTSNTGQVTTRLHHEDPPELPLKTLDWILTRDVGAKDPFVIPAADSMGGYLSDHELIGVVIRR